MDLSVVITFVLLAIGLALIAAEIFIPSGGFITVLALIAFAGSGFYAYESWWDTQRGSFWAFIGVSLVLVPVTAITMLWVLSHSRLGRHVFLEAPRPDEVNPYAREAEKRQALIGQVGETVTLMAPGGIVQVGSERHHAVTEGVMLDPGTTIRVVAVQGNRVVVRQHVPAVDQPPLQPAPEPELTGPELAATESKRNGNPPSDKPPIPDRHPEASPLDFEIPES